ncbi:hypothetical protein CES85_1615 [Ochrobactrum quorumnocens]|uniref:Uncharacterized protein n=1 Tax=Ochrobactrum quorumnocens TaxID=271865 RepID=A0A248UIR1_9HYPH|nr:hypothetical protein CES85_1615 [[Ochrobactrum] quorumnocens]
MIDHAILSFAFFREQNLATIFLVPDPSASYISYCAAGEAPSAQRIVGPVVQPAS